MAETKCGLFGGYSVSCLNDVLQQILVCERHHVLRLRCIGISQIPVVVVALPQIVKLLSGEEVNQIGIFVMARHVYGQIIQLTHQ